MRAALLAVLFAGLFNLISSLAHGAASVPLEADQKKEFARCWDYKAAPDLSVQSESDALNVYFVDTERRLIAVDLHSGAIVWSTDIGGASISNLLITDDSLLLVTAGSETAVGSEAVLRSLSKQTGITNWFVKIPGAQKLTIGALNGTLLAVEPSGTVAAFTMNAGHAKWSTGVGANITTAPFFSGSSVFVGTDRYEVIAIASASGDVSVAAKTAGVPAVVFSAPSGRLLIGDQRGSLVLTTTDGKRVWRFRNGARITSLSVYDSEYLAASNDNFVYKLSRGGNVEWKRRLSSRIDGRPLVIDDVAVFATVGDGNVYVIDLTNGKILNRFENGENNAAQAIAAGSNFVMVTEESLILFSRGVCPSNKKTAS